LVWIQIAKERQKEKKRKEKKRKGSEGVALGRKNLALT
jgi:hypothetical protein